MVSEDHFKAAFLFKLNNDHYSSLYNITEIAKPENRQQK